MAKKIKEQKIIRYLNRDFDGFRSDLLEFAKAHFADVITDFSDTSVSGMYLDLVAYVGDVMSFYQDHQFNELFIDTAREPKNVKRIAKQLGLKPQPASPATVTCAFFIEVPVVTNAFGEIVPDTTALFKIKAGSTISSDSGVIFETQEELDFSEVAGRTITIADVDSNNKPTSFFLRKNVICISGERKTLSVTLSNTYVKFRKIELSEKNVTQILRVVDTEANEYIEVDYLTQDTVFEAIKSVNTDKKDVPYVVNIKNVPHRYICEFDPVTDLTTVTFGAGQQSTVDDDIVPDPSSFAIPFYGKSTLTRYSVNPEQFLKTKTMGISPMGTTITFEVRIGGGLTHNVAERTINTLNSIIIVPLTDANLTLVSAAVSSLDVTNFEPSVGGENKQTLEDLKSTASSNFASQSRLVTREDYLARIYSMPAKFGKVFRAFIKRSENISLSIQIHILSRDAGGKLIISHDTLKKNLKTFINEYKMLTDSVDILDANIINVGIDFKIVVDSSFNQADVLNTTIQKLVNFFDVLNWQIGQPIIVDDVSSLIYNTEGIISISQLRFKNITGNIDGRDYSNTTFNVNRSTNNNIILCPDDSIFEVKYHNIDIRGATI